MTKKLFFFVLSISTLLFASCDKEPNTDHLKPQVSFEKEAYEAEAGTTVEITPTVANGKDATYKWETDGKEISTKETLTFTPAEAKDYTLTLTVTNKYGTAKAACVLKISAAAPYRNAVFMLDPGSRGDKAGAGNNAEKVNGRLMAVKADGSFVNDAFGTANAGKKLGYLCMQPVVFGGKIYILADAGSADFDKAELVIADANTLKEEKTLTFDIGYNRVSSLTIASDQKAYIGTGSKKLFPLNLTNGEKGANIEGLPRNFVGDIMNPITKIGNKVYGVSSSILNSEICAIDIATDQVSKSEIEGRIAFSMVEGGAKMAIVVEPFDMGRSKPDNLSFFSTTSNKVEGEMQKMPEGVSFASAISAERSEIYFQANKKNGEIHRYNYSTKQSELFVKVENATFSRLHVANNKLYYTYKLSHVVGGFKTAVYNLSDKALVGDTHSHNNIDVSYALTY